jgi:hypothetical protein
VKPKVYLAVPSCRDWKPQFGASMCGLVRKMTQDGVDFTLNAMTGTSVLPKARQLACDHALKEGYTHILFLDDDMSFNGDLFATLFAKQKRVVGANYSNKNPENPLPQTHGLDGKPLYSHYKEGAEEVGWLGFGAILIDLSILSVIEKPWFEMRWLPETQQYLGEDYYFCLKVRSHGVAIHVDHDAKCAHVGDYPYREVAVVEQIGEAA